MGWGQLGLLRFFCFCFCFAWLIFVESDAISFMNSEAWDRLGLLPVCFFVAWLIFVESDAISFMNSEGWDQLGLLWFFSRKHREGFFGKTVADYTADLLKLTYAA